MFVGVDGLDFAEVDRFIVDDLLLCALLKLVDDSGGWTSITTSGWRPSSSSAVDVESCLAVGLGTVSSTRFNDRQTKKINVVHSSVRQQSPTRWKTDR